MKVPVLILFFSVLLTSLPARAQVAAWTYHNDNFRTGANTNETVLTPANVNAATFGKLFSYAVDGLVYAQPLYVPNVNIPGRGLHNAVFIATEHNTVYAFDTDSAGASGGLLWKTNLGAAAVTTIAGVFTNRNFGTRYNNNSFTDITPEVGITGTPVIDTTTGTLYVDAFTGEPGGGRTNYFHRLHALNIADGTERSFSPVVVAASVVGTGEGSTNGRVPFNAQQHLQRCALTLAGGTVYVTYSGFADTDVYHGWVIGFNAANLALRTNHVFNTTPNSRVAQYGGNAGEGGIWMGGNGLAVDSNTNLYLMVGNGIFNATNNLGGTEYGDSFLKLSTANGLAVADYFTPYNQQGLASADTDLGSGGLVLLPNQPVNTRVLIGAGKEGKIYVLNRDQLTTGNNHFNANGSTDAVLQTDTSRLSARASFCTPAYFNGSIFMAASGDNLKAFPLANGLLAGTTLTDSARTFAFPGATPSLSANGNNNGIVWAIRRASPALLVACNAANLTEIYTSTNAAGNRDQLAGGVKFAVPTVADGKVFVGGSNSISVFGLLTGTFAFAAPTYSVTEANTTATIGVNRLGGTSGAVQVSYATVAGGSATSGADYNSVAGTLSWVNGETGTKTFTVTILPDAVTDPNETVNLALSNPTGNAALGAPATAALTIVETATPTDNWKLAHFGANANNNSIAGDTADPDNDGIANLLEYAYATDPNVANAPPFTANRAAGNTFQLRFPRNTFATDIFYAVQSSGSFAGWSNLMTYTPGPGWQSGQLGWTISETGNFGTAPDQYVNVIITSLANVAVGGPTNQFMRLQIHR
jgi:hypothetical protein